MNYQPGDVPNGHVLGEDNHWHPLETGQARASRTPGTGYWSRYLRRLPKVMAFWAVVTTVATTLDYVESGDPVPVVAVLTIAPVLGALTWGPVTTFIIALFPVHRR